MTELEDDWRAATRQCLGVRYSVAREESGKTDAGQSACCAFLLLMNAGAEEIGFMLPDARPNTLWTSMVETTSAAMPPDGPFDPGTLFRLAAHSLALFAGKD